MASTENPHSQFTYSEFQPVSSKKKNRNKKIWNLKHAAEYESVNQLVLKIRNQLNGKGEDSEGKWFGECSSVFPFFIAIIVSYISYRTAQRGLECIAEVTNDD